MSARSDHDRSCSLILFVATSNFVSMMTARAAGRAIEVGVRKRSASRGQIATQFLASACLPALALARHLHRELVLRPQRLLAASIAFDTCATQTRLRHPRNMLVTGLARSLCGFRAILFRLARS